jgi:hypothetical protein
MTIISLLVLAGFAFYVLNNDERRRALRPAIVLLGRGRAALGRTVAGAKWLVVGLVSGNPWAVITVVVTTVAIVLSAQVRGTNWQTLTDITPEIERLIALEEKATQVYDAAVAQLKLGAVSPEALAAIIKTSLIPELQEATLRLQALDSPVGDRRPLLSHAKEYLQLRRESWRLRAEALDQHSLSGLKTAETLERISLEALARLRSPDVSSR